MKCTFDACAQCEYNVALRDSHDAILTLNHMIAIRTNSLYNFQSTLIVTHKNKSHMTGNLILKKSSLILINRFWFGKKKACRYNKNVTYNFKSQYYDTVGRTHFLQA